MNRARLPLLAVVTATLWGWLLLERPLEAPGDARLLPGLQAAQVRRLRLDRGDGGEISELERRDDGWWLAGDLGRADDGVVQGILGALEYARREREPAVDRATAGFTAPRATLTVDGQTVRIGGEEPLGGGVYAETAAGIAVTDRHLADAIAVPPEGLRAAWLAGALPSLRRLGFGDATLFRHGAGWALTTRAGTVWADRERAEAILRALADARAESFLPVAPDGPAGIPITVDGHERARLGGRCESDRLLARRSDGAQLCFAPETLRPLTAAIADPAALRALAPVPIAVDQVRSLTLASGGRSLMLERIPEGWRIVAPSPGPADPMAVEGLIETIAAARGTDATPPLRAGAGPRLELIAEDGIRLVLVTVGRRGPDLVLERDGEAGLLALPSTFAALLDPDPARVRAAPVPDSPPPRPLD
ncbi:MAG: hypothetical protein EXR72_21490 [Myxococcales bacterium]|nr:hypothetical protein [Myxococcales bacterium]